MTLTYSGSQSSLRYIGQGNRTAEKLGTVYQKLASGLRINKPSDDIGGFILSEGLRRDSKIAAVALRSASDGVSLSSVTSSAIDQIQTLLTRMSELALQSSNINFTHSARSALSSEFVSLGSEIDRIAITTEYNNITVLSTGTATTFQVGFDSTSVSRITFSQVQATLSSLGLAVGGSHALTNTINGTTSVTAAAAASTAYSVINNALTTLNTQRGYVNAANARLSSAIEYLSVARENFIAADAKIRDIDVAKSVAEMISLQIGKDAAAAVQAQANQDAERVLKLLE